MRTALRLPYVAVWDAYDKLASDGVASSPTSRVPLEYAGQKIAELEIGLRRGEQQLTSADLSTLQLVGAPLAVAVRALGLSADLRLSQSGLLVAREDERRRLRRDLHDGLGPTLTGMALAADAGTQPPRQRPGADP